MAGIYVHIPFCRKACHYCNFHFSTQTTGIAAMVQAMVRHISWAPLSPGADALHPLSTIYFGGGTPSLLGLDDLDQLLTAIHQRFTVLPQAEVTLETNPDDMTAEKLKGWQQLGINRLSIGVQSFFDADLQWMNRAHNAQMAVSGIALAQQLGLHNISIDLIYGTPTLSAQCWQANVEQALALQVPHISCYALTVEPKTALHSMVAKGKTPPISDDTQSQQFLQLMNWMQTAGYEHYEISNFCLPGQRSRHNSSYWSGQPYYGIGPSAHGYNGKHTRWWNVANNALYVQAIEQGLPHFEHETLTPVQHLNEQIMTGIRMHEGIAINRQQGLVCTTPVGDADFLAFTKKIDRWQQRQMLVEQQNRISLTHTGKLYADGIAADLFF
ncbi:MAG: radical SAM family heme chaperone HemW [Bacteroidetes bacterium]|nr:MAG: radical SAM family heme chaperone HemW [Bacteroidota bacterium]